VNITTSLMLSESSTISMIFSINVRCFFRSDIVGLW
jgi:hypothetical protein